jgi:hypothetical protein
VKPISGTVDSFTADRDGLPLAGRPKGYGM